MNVIKQKSRSAEPHIPVESSAMFSERETFGLYNYG